MKKEEFFNAAIKELKGSKGRLTALQLLKLKNKLSGEYHLSEVPKNPELIQYVEVSNELDEEEKLELKKLLKIKNARAISGISNVAIMTKPSICPGKCIYCPGGLAWNTPKSYTGKEPAARRAAMNDYDAYKQVQARIRQFKILGHEPQKCEVIIQGGTFNALPLRYQEDFVKRMYDAFNGIDAENLETAKRINENALHRVIGLTFETRPDFCNEIQIRKFLEFGATRIEIGVQTLDDEVQRLTKRGHGNKSAIDATQMLRNSLFKVCYHMMPGLFSNKEKDVEMFKELFANPDFKPDMLKIYPCLVIPDTELYEMWKRGEFKPYTSEEAAEVISEAKKYIPKYCRIMRIKRDIPSNLVADGVKMTNLRDLVKEKIKQKGIKCNCIRCREAGFKMLKEKVQLDFDAVELKRMEYYASGGKEIFLSFEEAKGDALLALLRLRIPNNPFLSEITENTAGIRELHVYGEQQAVIGSSATKFEKVQHKGFGSKLLAEAERIAREECDMKKMLVISGVGVRNYYRKRGYELEGFYMSKRLKPIN